jgi:hypothetical protein
MAAAIAFGVLALAAAASLIGGLVLAARQFLFIAKSYRVLGRVSGEWNYRTEGHQMRYYRVEFCLSNGQLAQLRSSVTSPSRHPKVGQEVPVLIREEAGNVKARIGTMMELWFVVLVLLIMGGTVSLVLWLVAYTLVVG